MCTRHLDSERMAYCCWNLIHEEKMQADCFSCMKLSGCWTSARGAVSFLHRLLGVIQSKNSHALCWAVWGIALDSQLLQLQKAICSLERY